MNPELDMHAFPNRLHPVNTNDETNNMDVIMNIAIVIRIDLDFCNVYKYTDRKTIPIIP